MILDEFRTKNLNQNSDEGDINFTRLLSTKINKAFWRRALRAVSGVLWSAF